MSNTVQKILFFSTLTVLIILSGCNEKSTKSKNSAPVINSVLVNPNTVGVGGTVTITVDAQDPDEGDQLNYTYIPSNGAINGSGSIVQWIAPQQAGAYSVTVTVKDQDGAEDTGIGNLTVTAVQVVTQVTGSAYFPAGVNGNLYNAKVSLYTSLQNWINYSHIKFVSAVGEGANVTFTIPDVNPGNYYLDVWKDNDNSGAWSTGDFVGWYGSGGLAAPSLTEFQIAEGQTVVINVSMFII